jgi:hypothetical protein
MTGAEQLKNGVATAMQIDESGVVGTAVSLRMIGNRLYVKLPHATNGKAWLEVSASSSDPILRRLALQLGAARQQAAANAYGPLVASASSMRTVGPATVNGVQTIHYRLQIDPAKEHNPLLSAAELRDLARLGVHSLPLDIWLDAQGRPIKIVDRLHVYGNDVLTTLTMDGLNDPVHIVPPPAGETTTGVGGLLSSLTPSA